MKILINCDHCGNSFERVTIEVNRSKKLGRKQYCSKQCHAPYLIQNIPKDKRSKKHDKLNSGNRYDEYSQFRSHLKRIKNRKHEVTVNLDDLKRQWDLQEGKCPFTKWDLEIDRTTEVRIKLNPKKASLDRIDSSKGYTPENIRWVSVIANYAKNGFSDEEVYKFASSVVENMNPRVH
jgi:hypothetical protein